MIIDVLSLFPDIFASFLSQSLLAKALAKGLLAVNLHDIRAHAHDRRGTADDRPYGGGPGMVMKPEPLAEALDEAIAQARARGQDPPLVINLTPSGKLLTQDLAKSLAEKPRLALICGRYEGVDQRVLDLYADMDLSIGDYVLSGGEVPAMVVIEAVSRLLPGFMGHEESTLEESHGYGLLEHPLYTRPRLWRGLAVPDALLSGDHAQVAAYRLAEAVARTRAVRPELLERPDLLDRIAEVLERPGAPLEGKRCKAKRGKRPRGSPSGSPGSDRASSESASRQGALNNGGPSASSASQAPSSGETPDGEAAKGGPPKGGL
jgi:tRNA (guanine37-N1)-methyltransferase